MIRITLLAAFAAASVVSAPAPAHAVGTPVTATVTYTGTVSGVTFHGSCTGRTVPATEHTPGSTTIDGYAVTTATFLVGFSCQYDGMGTSGNDFAPVTTGSDSYEHERPLETSPRPICIAMWAVVRNGATYVTPVTCG